MFVLLNVATVEVSVAPQTSTPASSDNSDSGGTFSFLMLIGIGAILVTRKGNFIRARR